MAMLDDALRTGLDELDATGAPVSYRYLLPTDSPDDITLMLHESYAPLAAAGMRFIASHQSATTTRKRLALGETIVAQSGGGLVGIVTLVDTSKTHGTPFYDRPDVASIEQYAVRVTHQGRRIGARLLALAEERAREKGVAHLGLDTSEHAEALIALYQRRGFAFVEHVQWRSTNYRSMVFAKQLR